MPTASLTWARSASGSPQSAEDRPPFRYAQRHECIPGADRRAPGDAPHGSGFLALPRRPWLPGLLHWMWWPAIGGLVIGIGGYFQPRALGVGYDTIASLVQTADAPGRGRGAQGAFLPRYELTEPLAVPHSWVRQAPVSRNDLRVRQPLFKVLHPTLRDLNACKVDAAEFSQPIQMRQPGVGDLRLVELEDRKFGQPIQMRQPGVGDVSTREVEKGRAWSAPFRCKSPASET